VADRLRRPVQAVQRSFLTGSVRFGPVRVGSGRFWNGNDVPDATAHSVFSLEAPRLVRLLSGAENACLEAVQVVRMLVPSKAISCKRPSKQGDTRSGQGTLIWK
jgi:hypothetical protein